jgi:hypothetical protein
MKVYKAIALRQIHRDRLCRYAERNRSFVDLAYTRGLSFKQRKDRLQI